MRGRMCFQGKDSLLYLLQNVSHLTEDVLWRENTKDHQIFPPFFVLLRLIFKERASYLSFLCNIEYKLKLFRYSQVFLWGLLQDMKLN